MAGCGDAGRSISLPVTVRRPSCDARPPAAVPLGVQVTAVMDAGKVAKPDLPILGTLKVLHRTPPMTPSNRFRAGLPLRAVTQVVRWPVRHVFARWSRRETRRGRDSVRARHRLRSPPARFGAVTAPTGE